MEVEPSVSVLASTSNDTKTAEANIRPNQRNMGRRSASSTSTASSGKSRRSRPKSESQEEPVKFEIGSVSSESLASSATDADVEDPNEEPENLKTSKTKTSRTPRSSRKSLQILNNKASNHTCTVKSKLSQIDEDPIGESKKSIKKTRVNNLDENTLDGFSSSVKKKPIEENLTSLGDKVNPDENSQDTEATSSILSALIDNSKPESQPKIDQLDETTGDCDVILKNDLDEDSKPAADTNDEHGPKKKRKKRSTLMLHHNLNLEFSKDGTHFSVSKLFVYKWPMSDEELDEYEDSSDSKQTQNNNSEPTVEEKLGKYVNKILATSPIDELYILQEQVSEYLGVKSFKRKYPEIFRRLTEVKEREFLLRKMQVVTESQCDLGLTALKLNECLDLMAYDYPDKFKEFDQYFNEKRRRAIATAAFQAASLSLNRNKSEIFDAPRSSSSRTNLSEKDKMKEMVRKAMESVATYNSQIQREKLEERKSFFDLQTMRIQSPQSVVNKKDDHLFSNDKKGHYPVSLLPGQFQYYYKNYTSHELKYLPLDTVIYAPPIPDRLKYIEWKKSLNKPKQNDSIRKVNELRPAKTEVDSENKKISPVKNSDAGRQSIRITASAAPTIAKLISCTNQICHICQKSSQINQNSSFIDNNQLMVSCSSCTKHIHPVCLELNPTLVDWTCIRNYNWQCIECKVCSKCNKSNDEDKMMFCDRCDRGFHTYCANVENVPNGSWLCKSCTDFTDKLNAIQEKINNSKTQIKPEVNTPNKIKQNLKQKLSAALTPTATPNNGEKRGRGRPPGSANKPKDPNLQKKIKAARGQKIKDSVNGFYSNSNSQMYSLQSPMTNSNLQFDDELNDSLMNYEANNYETQFGSVNSTPYFQMDETSNSQFQF